MHVMSTSQTPPFFLSSPSQVLAMAVAWRLHIFHRTRRADGAVKVIYAKDFDHLKRKARKFCSQKGGVWEGDVICSNGNSKQRSMNWLIDFAGGLRPIPV